jgi:hypothetical protein
MIIEFFQYLLKPIKVYVLLTFIFAILNFNRKIYSYKILLLILGVSIMTEIVNSFLLFNNKTIGFSTTISIIVTNALWIILLLKYTIKIKSLKYILFFYFSFCIVNMFLVEGVGNFNYYTFLGGALLYIFLFIMESFYQLKKENFTFFQSNNYLLLFSPVLFFFGLSFVFGFKSKELAETIIFSNLKLYDFIIYFVNVIYYTLINIYIYREKRLKHA